MTEEMLQQLRALYHEPNEVRRSFTLKLSSGQDLVCQAVTFIQIERPSSDSRVVVWDMQGQKHTIEGNDIEGIEIGGPASPHRRN